jgi:hypothetical protein
MAEPTKKLAGAQPAHYTEVDKLDVAFLKANAEKK